MRDSKTCKRRVFGRGKRKQLRPNHQMVVEPVTPSDDKLLTSDMPFGVDNIHRSYLLNSLFLKGGNETRRSKVNPGLR